MSVQSISKKDAQKIGHICINSVEEHPDFKLIQKRVIEELKQVGISRWGLLMEEAQYLPRLIHEDEHIRGVAYGHDTVGYIMLVATNRRVIFLDKKPLFVKTQDISYDVVGGVEFDWLIYRGLLTLNTRFGDYKVRMYNKNAAKKFENYVERKWLEVHNGAVYK